MRILLLGSTGRIGSRVQRAALEAGHEVVALVRADHAAEDHERLSVVAGDLQDAATLDGLLARSDAVIATMGPRSNTPAEQRALEDAMATLVEAMQRSSVSRLVALSGAAVDAPGDRKPFADRVMSRIVRRAARHIVGAKQGEFETFSGTRLEWTALRPPLVTDGSPRGYRLSGRLRPGARVSRADVAQALVDQVEDRSFIRAAPFVLPPER